MILTIISDTHNKHKHITGDLKGGDLLIHAGDLSSMGYEHEITEFAKWYNGLDNYSTKVFIAGNHDWGFQNNSEKIKGLLTGYKDINYLEDDFLGIIEGGEPEIKIWGSPWQPEFYNWAFNRTSETIGAHWDKIPLDTNILITHGPIRGYLDLTERGESTGCPILRDKMGELKDLKLHVCGHIHEASGIQLVDRCLHVPASQLTEHYELVNLPYSIELP